MTKPSPVKINKITIDEMRRTYDALSNTNDKLRVKILTFIGAGLALMTYLYNDNSLFIPNEIYGMIFYFTGLGFIIAAMIILLLGLRPHPWRLTTEIKQIKKNDYKNEEEYLEYVKEQYVEAFELNSKGYESRHSSVNVGFVLLIVGAFILIVIKNFPDSIKPCYNKGSAGYTPVRTK